MSRSRQDMGTHPPAQLTAHQPLPGRGSDDQILNSVPIPLGHVTDLG